jgi:phage tail-like protein
MGDGGISAAPDKRSWKMKGSAPSATSRSATSSIADPEGNFVFALELNGSEVAHFLECSGLKTTTEVFELQEGGMNYAVHKLPGQSKWENIQLRYGVSQSTTLLGWRDQILQDSFTAGSRLNGAIVVKNNQMQVVRRYNFVDAWPVSWEGPSFQASGAELAIESVELAHHGIYVS